MVVKVIHLPSIFKFSSSLFREVPISTLIAITEKSIIFQISYFDFHTYSLNLMVMTKEQFLSPGFILVNCNSDNGKITRRPHHHLTLSSNKSEESS